MTVATTFGAALLTAALLGGASAATAQSMDSTGGGFNAGWGRSEGQESRGFQPRNTRDGNGNRLIVDGIMQTGEDQSSYASSSGAYGGESGAGYGGNTAVGNNLSVNVIGSWNTVIVDSTQINNGDIIAGNQRSGELNGGVDLHD